MTIDVAYNEGVKKRGIIDEGDIAGNSLIPSLSVRTI